MKITCTVTHFSLMAASFTVWNRYDSVLERAWSGWVSLSIMGIYFMPNH
ncbi:unnamed protein product [Staurois parvus]|uniref:Uncharacterized protein n=1 Tax=Staurois parvus TaxID=386267 RepID=A0ABN9EI01_9NEOB|nr:unnamed protein product [Staurois parvus]